jgi:hypothetical protein
MVVTTVRMKEEWKRQRDGSNTSTGFIVWDGALQCIQPKPEAHCHLQTFSRYREGSRWDIWLDGRLSQNGVKNC